MWHVDLKSKSRIKSYIQQLFLAEQSLQSEMAYHLVTVYINLFAFLCGE